VRNLTDSQHFAEHDFIIAKSVEVANAGLGLKATRFIEGSGALEFCSRDRMVIVVSALTTLMFSVR
jgi:hypothetical protein